MDYDTQKVVLDEHPGFDLDIDYLFLDTNGNGTRDHGNGFAESTPAYGEPLFVFDDVNHDHATETSEWLIQLKTSKFKAIHSNHGAFTRGVEGAKGLSQYLPEDKSEVTSQMWHATATSGILVGGQPGISRWTGLAPGADLLLYEKTGRGFVTATQWAIDQKANVVLAETGVYNDVSLDGSSEEEAILDAAHDKGIVTVTPAGNLAQSLKHLTVTLQPGSQTIITGTKSDIRAAGVSIHYRGPERNLTVTMKTPLGEVIEFPDSDPTGTPHGDDKVVYVMKQTTPRGTHERFIDYVSDSVLPKGTYELTVSLDPGDPLEIDVFVADGVNAWEGGFTLAKNTSTRTICNPATSDKTIAVAAYVLQEQSDDTFHAPGTKGAVAGFSSRGPTLGGADGIDIAAPDNPISAAPPAQGVGGATWTIFGGTSGAGPHVAAAVALLAQAYPDDDADERKKRLLDAADPMPGEATSIAGRGKLDIARAVDAKVLSGAAPRPTLVVVRPPTEGGAAVVRVTAEDDEPALGLTARWDLDYDGTFDTGWLPLGEPGDQIVPLVVDAKMGAKTGVKVEVRDTQGNLNGATATLEVGPPIEPAAKADVGCGCRTVCRDTSASWAPLSIAVLAMTLARRIRFARRRASSAR